MTLDLAVAGKLPVVLQPIPVAVTTFGDGFANGLMSSPASTVPEPPRATVHRTKCNKTDKLRTYP